MEIGINIGELNIRSVLLNAIPNTALLLDQLLSSNNGHIEFPFRSFQSKNGHVNESRNVVDSITYILCLRQMVFECNRKTFFIFMHFNACLDMTIFDSMIKKY